VNASYPDAGIASRAVAASLLLSWPEASLP
jgi:hypothetical protein